MPSPWSRVDSWLNHTGNFSLTPASPPPAFKLKCPEIPTLVDYSSRPANNFWRHFPRRNLPEAINPKINVIALKSLLNNFKHLLTSSQIFRAEKVIENLSLGAPSYQQKQLPSCFVKNSSIAFQYGKEVTDSIAHWINQGFACGPFDSPPCDKFRVNSILAVPQDGKVRAVLNVSLPEGNSFNDNIDVNLMEKVKMSSAREFGFLVKKCGKNAIMSKFDVKDAYKNIPAKLLDLWLQGFCWLGKFFIDLSQIFGARSAVCNYDQSGHTTTDLAVVASNVPPEFVLRHLDDVPVVAPAKSQHCQNFSREYVRICSELNLELQSNCPQNEKAFTNVTFGKVLGIWFNSKNLSWTLPAETNK